MRIWILHTKLWISLWSYGPDLVRPPSIWKRTSGSGSVGFYSPLLNTSWQTMTNQLLDGLLSTSQRLNSRWSRLTTRYKYNGSHRGHGRISRAGQRLLRDQREVALENQRAFAELSRDRGLVGIASIGPGARAYRKLRWEAPNGIRRIRARQYQEDIYEQVP